MLHLKITPIEHSEKEILYRIEDLNGVLYIDAWKIFIDDSSIENYNLKQGDIMFVTAMAIEAKGVKDDRDKGAWVAEEVSIKTIYSLIEALNGW